MTETRVQHEFPSGGWVTERLYHEAVELYDIAFGWDVSDEVAWLCERLGPRAEPVLEPGCGTGRMLEALARRGVSACGFDRSPEMVAYARRRLDRHADLVEVRRADMVAFDLDERFGGAICPVNTLGYLSPGDLSRHLEAVGRHLRPGARYLVQLDLYERGTDPRGSATWTASRDDTELEVTWSVEASDPLRRIQLHRSRITVVSGPRPGAVLDEIHTITAWTPAEWSEAIAASPFDYAAVHDGDRPDRPALPVGAEGELLWHELVVRRGG